MFEKIFWKLLIKFQENLFGGQSCTSIDVREPILELSNLNL